MAQRTYIKWNDPRVEWKDPNEDADIAETTRLINQIQQQVFENHRHAWGGTHVKTHGLVKGELVVPDNLPQHLAQGVFATPGKHPICMRYSTEPSDVIDDRIPQPRGIGMKVFDVPGKKMRPDGKDVPTHDFEFNSSSILELRNAKTCAEIIGLRVKHAAEPEKLAAILAARPDAKMQDGRNHLPNIHLAGQRQYSQSAMRHGDYVAKYVLVPSSATQKALKEQWVKQEDPSYILKDWLQKYFKENEATYELQAQLLENIDEQPVEDSGIDWDQQKYPYETIAIITIPPQESFSAARRVFWEDHMRLDPWHGVYEHQPLGSINRLRKGVYEASSVMRRKLNAKQEVTVMHIDEIPN